LFALAFTDRLAIPPVLASHPSQLTGHVVEGDGVAGFEDVADDLVGPVLALS
jgi:hypothetical protein